MKVLPSVGQSASSFWGPLLVLGLLHLVDGRVELGKHGLLEQNEILGA